MKNIILISDNKNYQFNSLEELKEFLIPGYKMISADELKKIFYEKVFGYSIMYRLQIVDTKKGVYGDNYSIDNNKKYDLNYSIIIDDFDTYILSLCKYNIIYLFEEINNREFSKNIKIEKNEDNYIVINSFANQILKEMVG